MVKCIFQFSNILLIKSVYKNNMYIYKAVKNIKFTVTQKYMKILKKYQPLILQIYLFTSF